MATYTPNLGLKKPEGSDYVLISDLNGNMDILEQVIGDPAKLEATDKTTLVTAINEAIKRGGEQSPYINPDTGTWWAWDFTTWQYVDTGVDATGPAAGFGIPTAAATGLDAGAMPTVAVTAAGPNDEKVFDFQFGIPKGDKGDSLAFADITADATATESGGEPSVNIEVSGPDTAKNVHFDFVIPRGDYGADAEITDVTATVDNTSGNPAVTVELGGTPASRTMQFNFTGIRGVDGLGSVSSVNGARPNADGEVTLIVTRSVTLSVGGWVDKVQTVSVAGAVADGTKQHVLSGPAPESVADAVGVQLIAQGDGALTYRCSETPESDVTMHVMLIGGQT